MSMPLHMHMPLLLVDGYEFTIQSTSIVRHGDDRRDARRYE